MKSKTIVAAAILMAAMMVVPIALTAFEDAPSAAEDPLASSSSGGIMDMLSAFSATSFDPSELANLAGAMEDLLTYEQVPSAAVAWSADTTLPNGTLLKDNYTASKDVVVTVQTGSTIVICPAQPFTVTTSGYAKFVFEEGSSIAFTSDGDLPALTGDNVLFQKDFEDDDTICFNGTLTNTWTATIDGNKTTVDYSLTVAKDSTIRDSLSDTEWRSVTTFTEEAKLSIHVVADINTTTGASKVDATAKGNMNLKNDERKLKPGSTTEYDTYTSTATASIDYEINVDTPAAAAGATAVYKVNGSAKANATINADEIDNMTFSISNSTGATVRVPYEATGPGTPSFDASLSVSAEVGGFSTTTDTGTLEFSGASASVNVSASDKTVNVNVNGNVGKLDVNTVDARGTIGRTYIDGLNVNLTYEGEIVDGSAVTAAVPSLSSSSKPIDILTKLIADYLKGAATTEKEIHEYACDFFLGEFDKAAKIDGMVKSTYVKATVSLGAFVTISKSSNTEIRGVDATIEISKSGGLFVTAGLDKFSTKSTSEMTVIEPANVTIKTSEDKTQVAIVEFSGNMEKKEYDNGFLVANPYINGAYVKLAVAETTTIQEFTVSEMVTNTFGIDEIASGLSYDPVNKQFAIGEMTIRGDYYGDAPIRSVDGHYYDVTIAVKGVSAMAPPVIGSSDITLTDVYGSTMNFKRSYDATATAPTYNNTVTTTGQVDLTAILNDEVLYGILFYDQNASPTAATIENFTMSGIAYVYGGSIGISTIPCVEVNDGNITFYSIGQPILSGKFSGEIYATSPTFVSYVTIGTTPYTLDFDGSALGILVADDGTVTNNVVAFPGYKLAETGMTVTNLTLSDITDKKATAVIGTGSSITLRPVAEKYNVYINGELKGENFTYGVAETIDNIEATALFDKNGAVVGEIDNLGTWTYKRVSGTGDLELTSVKVETYANPSATELNTSDKSAITFTASTGMKFALGSGVRFDLIDTSLTGTNVNLIAEKTTFNGREAFLVKAQRVDDGASIGTTLYIPVSGEGQKVMHVDDFGRSTEYASTLVKIGDQYYMKTNVYDYSIFYTESDEPRHDVPGGNGTNILLFVGIGAAVAIIAAAGAFFFIRKH